MTTDSFSGKSEGKEHLTNAIMGLIFLIGGYIIFLEINPNILNIDFSTASGKVDIEVKEVDINLDIIEGNYEEVVDDLARKGYLRPPICSGDFWKEEDAIRECNKMRVKENKATSQCFKSNVGWLTYSYCYMINTREEEKKCVDIKKSEGYRCNIPCHKFSCDTGLKSEIEKNELMQGVETFVCKNDGKERSTACYKGDRIDKSVYNMTVSCKYKWCSNKFHDLARKEGWGPECEYKLVYKKYDGEIDESEFWIYVNKKKCK